MENGFGEGRCVSGGAVERREVFGLVVFWRKIHPIDLPQGIVFNLDRKPPFVRVLNFTTEK